MTKQDNTYSDYLFGGRSDVSMLLDYVYQALMTRNYVSYADVLAKVGGKI